MISDNVREQSTTGPLWFHCERFGGKEVCCMWDEIKDEKCFQSRGRQTEQLLEILSAAVEPELPLLEDNALTRMETLLKAS